MRALKDKYPCTLCREPMEVRCRRDIPDARCGRCAERMRLSTLGGFLDERATLLYLSVNNKTDDIPLLVAVCLEAVSKRADAASCWIKASRMEGPLRARHLVRCAKSRAEWCRTLMTQIEPFLEKTLDGMTGHLSALPGDAMPLPENLKAPPVLFMVRDEKRGGE